MNTHISKQLTCALLAITLLCAGITVRGQQLRWNWATQATGSLDNHICATICDTAGNIFLSGSYVDTLHFGALSIPPYGGQDIFIAKFDPHGTPIWMESAGGRADDYPTAMTISNSGDIIIAGICGKDTKFNNEPSSRHKTNFFFSVYAPDGKFKWSQAFQASRSDYIKAITVGPGGKIYFAGYFSKPFDFIGTQVEPSSAINAMVGCLDSLGSPEWIQPFTCEYGENRITALCHRNNEFWLAGSCNAPTRIGETVISPAIDGTLALFVASFDEAGNVSNIATPLFSPDAEITSMTTTDNGLLVLGGNFNDRLFFNRPPNPPGEIINGLPPIGELFPEENILGLSSFSAHGNQDMFLAAITTSDGKQAWTKQLGSKNYDYLMNLATHPWDYLIVSGLYAGNLIADKDTITLNNPFCDVFTASYNNSGQIQEFTSMGGTAEEYPQAMAYDKDGHVFVAGIFRDTTNLQHATLYTPSGSEEIFLSKLHHCSKHRVVFTCDTVFSEGDILMLGVKDTYKEYTWDDGRSVAPNYIIYYNKTYQLLVSDSLGCVYRDSITIRQIPVVPDWQIRAELFNEKSGHHLLFADSFTAARRED